MRLASTVAAAVFAADQLSKYAVVHLLGLSEKLAINVVPPYLNFRMAWNQGVNFGLFANTGDLMRWVLVAIALAIATWVWVWVRREPHSLLVQIAAGLLVGGALGNVVDRVLYGAVADFLNMSCCGIDNPFAFNIADVGIAAGAVGLIVFSGREKSP